MLFSRLLDHQNPNPENTGSNVGYLGTKVQSDVARLTPVIEEEFRKKIKQLQSAKKRMILERLGTRNFEHPSFSEIDFSDKSSIHRFLARENIKCALICDPFQSLEQLSMLCDIINSEYDSSRAFPHISIFRGYEESKKRGDTPEDLVTYFKIHLLPTKQKQEDMDIIIKEFRGIVTI